MVKFFRRWGITILLLLGIAAVVVYNVYRRNQYKKDHVYVELRAFHTDKGWGYEILQDGRIYIHQDVVPAIASRGWGFRTKEDALAVGKRSTTSSSRGRCRR
ncbi:DUF4907 domain-containing protein [Puia sp. P3]|uniref:DUF4907 domain-containing protein n=1 Tax=Puia sp. P3 TaxID=3423952 RepID=UPI003D663F11